MLKFHFSSMIFPRKVFEIYKTDFIKMDHKVRNNIIFNKYYSIDHWYKYLFLKLQYLKSLLKNIKKANVNETFDWTIKTVGCINFG